MGTLTIPNAFADGTVADAVPMNANFQAIQAFSSNIDNANIGPLGIYASQVIPTSKAQATFGGTRAYYFPLGTIATQAGWFSVIDSGADPTGVTACDTAFAAAVTAASGAEIYVPPGTYSLTSTASYVGNWRFAAGAKVSVASTKTITFSGSVIAPPTQIFSGAGAVLLTGPTPIVYAEWFGALCNGSNDDALAMSAACAALTRGGRIKLLARTYTWKTTVTCTNHCVVVAGVNTGMSPYDYGGAIAGTQIVGINGTNGLVFNGVGYPRVENLDISLAVGATSACVAIWFESCFLPKAIDVRTTNYSTGIHLTGCTDIYVQRGYFATLGSTVATVAGVDIDGGSHVQNASVYISDCIAAHASFGGTTSYGYYLHGNRINDMTLDICESDGCIYGAFVDGSTVDAGYGGDINFNGFIADGCTNGIEVSGLATDSYLTIIGGWMANSAANIIISGSNGISITGVKVNGGNYGVEILNSQLVTVSGCIFKYQAIECVTVSNSPVCSVTANTFFQKSAAGVPAIHLESGSTHCSVVGNTANANASGGFSYGLLTDAGTDFCNAGPNSFPTPACTNSYQINSGSNTHTVVTGTTA